MSAPATRLVHHAPRVTGAQCACAQARAPRCTVWATTPPPELTELGLPGRPTPHHLPASPLGAVGDPVTPPLGATATTASQLSQTVRNSSSHRFSPDAARCKAVISRMACLATFN